MAVESRRIRWIVLGVRVAELRITYKILVENLEGKRSLGRTRRRRKDIRIVLQEAEFEGVTRFIRLKMRSSGGIL